MNFTLPPPRDLAEDERTQQVGASVKRIWNGAEELKVNGEAISVESTQAGGHSATEMWMLLLVRMVTRVADPHPTPMDGDDAMDNSSEKELEVQDFYVRQDQQRQILCDYIMSDFPSRYVESASCIANNGE